MKEPVGSLKSCERSEGKPNRVFKSLWKFGHGSRIPQDAREGGKEGELHLFPVSVKSPEVQTSEPYYGDRVLLCVFLVPRQV